MAELVWDGKYDKDGQERAPVRLALPFQTVETVNESVQERQRSLELSGAAKDSEWRNRLIWGDKQYVLPSLLPEFAGKVDLIYSYYPDFVAVSEDGTHLLLETKGQETPDVRFKDAAAERWCENASAFAKVRWRYLKIPQKDFENLRPRTLGDLSVLAHLMSAAGRGK